VIAIIAALTDEIADFLAQGRFRETVGTDGNRCFESTSERDVAVVAGGIGRERAELATRLAIERYEPDLVISAGFAGAVRRGFSTGDIVLCDRVWSLEGPREGWSRDSARSLGVREGASDSGLANVLEEMRPQPKRADCLSVPRLIADSRTKEWIGTQLPVELIDMEAFWVCQTAARYDAATIVVKSVFDPVEQTLPPSVAQLAGSGAVARWRAALAIALSRPGQIPGLVRLAGQAAAARRALALSLCAIASRESYRAISRLEA
jgi:adenosylhomocysteine nucleosidase